MKTLVDNCNHKYLLKIGEQDDGKGGYFLIGNCRDCNNTITISDKYKRMIGKFYQLKEKHNE